MAATANVRTMYDLLSRSRLVSPDRAKDILQRWVAESKDVEDAEKFRRFLVAQGFATDYQATLLAHGRSEGYFIAEYKILDRAGQGRMAGVYRAQSPGNDQVALKVLPPSKAKNSQLLARFQREAKLAAQMEHANVVRTLAVGEADNLNYLVMEYLEGETFDVVLTRRKKIPIGEAVHVVHQALLGLQHIHEKSVVHRDLKPANLMLVPGIMPGAPDITLNSVVKILDIGLGREVFEDTIASDPAQQLTSEGVLLGTPDYLAPEQARDAHSVDIRADIYSLGCVLYHAISGQPPFPDTNVMSQMIRHAREAPAPLVQFNPEVPDGLQQIVNFMMAKDPAQRYPTPDRAAKALQMFLPVMETVVFKKPEPAAEIPVGKLISAGARVEKPAAKPAPKAEPKAPEKAVKKPAPAPAPALAVPAPSPAPIPALPVAGQASAKAAEMEYDVELVAIPIPPPTPIKPKLPRDQRKLYDLDRRDFIMLSAGTLGTLAAVLAAVGLARAVRKKPEE